MKDNKRLGGVIIEPNYLSHFFIEPPYTSALFDIVKELDNALMSWANKDQKTYIYGINPKHVEIFNKVGYRHQFIRKPMIRPTEMKVYTINWASCLGQK